MTMDELHTLWDKKNGGKAAPMEHRLQVECLRWLRLVYPSVLCYAIPNGGQRNAIVAAKLKEEGATAGMTFPNGTTKFDRFVAFNAAYADFCKSFSDEDVLRIAYDFYFADEDWKGSGKIWEYMSMNV